MGSCVTSCPSACKTGAAADRPTWPTDVQLDMIKTRLDDTSLMVVTEAYTRRAGPKRDEDQKRGGSSRYWRPTSAGSSSTRRSSKPAHSSWGMVDEAKRLPRNVAYAGRHPLQVHEDAAGSSSLGERFSRAARISCK